MPDTEAVLAHALTDPESGWNIGAFGAVAEFHQDPGESAEIATPLARTTARGAIRLDGLAHARPVAWEAPARDLRRWHHGIALCLPEAEALRAARSAIEELGPDVDAIRPRDREAIIFDLGLALPQVDFCVRTREPSLIETLRSARGHSLFESGNPVMGAILEAHPHRIAISHLGRVEVFQKIGGPETGGTSPEGPHTHLLPKLLAARRTHPASTPIPEGLTPCASLHPGNPVSDALGRDREFDPALHDAFQALFEVWGREDCRAVKRRVRDAIRAGISPESFDAPATRAGRAAVLVTLRQMLRGDGPFPLLRRWLAHFDGATVHDLAGDDAGENAPHAP